MNNSIQYDSYHKFLVSLGTILIVGPIIGFKFILFDVPDILISTSTYNDLSEVSTEIFNTKMTCLRYVYYIAPVICIISVMAGFILLFLGCKKWKQTQSIKDDNDRIDHELKKRNFEKQSVDEVVANKLENIIESHYEVEHQAIATPSSQAASDKPVWERWNQSAHDLTTKYSKIEERVFNYIKTTLGPDYIVEPNMRYKGNPYDLIAVSNNKTIYYEIKYWTNSISKASLARIRMMYQEVSNYLGNNEFKLVVVTPNKEILSLVKDNKGKMGLDDDNILILEEEDLPTI